MAHPCRRAGCKSLGTKFCAACGDASYCSVDCQKEDWKVHKLSCIDINELPTTFLPYSQVMKIAVKLQEKVAIVESQKKYFEAIDLTLKCLAFVENQIGVPVIGSKYWMRSNGELVDNSALIGWRITIAKQYDMTDNAEAAVAHGQITRQMLEHRDKSADQDLLYVSSIELILSSSYLALQKHHRAEFHCCRSLKFARLIKGERRIHEEYRALLHYGNIRTRQKRHPAAVEFCKEAYILVSEAFGPVHPFVQDAATQLIGHLLENGDYAVADDYCRMNYENLIDPQNAIDQDDGLIAHGMTQMAKVWLYKDPVDDEEAAIALAEEAEDMARKTCKCDDLRLQNQRFRYELLSNVLLRRDKYTDETRRVLEQVLALCRYLKSGVKEYLGRLYDFHFIMAEMLPPGDARELELRRGERYLIEEKLFAGY